MRIDLARHGEPVFNEGEGRVYNENAPLSENGRRQVQALGDLYRNVPIAAIYSSSIRRARESAEEFARSIAQGAEPLPISELPGLAEPDLGGAVGRLFSSFPPMPNGNGIDLYNEDLGQEATSDVARRARPEIDKVVKQTGPDNIVVIFSHGLLVKMEAQYLRDPHAPIPHSESELREDDQLPYAGVLSLTLDDKGTVVHEKKILA